MNLSRRGRQNFFDWHPPLVQLIPTLDWPVVPILCARQVEFFLGHHQKEFFFFDRRSFIEQEMHYWSTEDGCLDSIKQRTRGLWPLLTPPAADAYSLLSSSSRLTRFKLS